MARHSSIRNPVRLYLDVMISSSEVKIQKIPAFPIREKKHITGSRTAFLKCS